GYVLQVEQLLDGVCAADLEIMRRLATNPRMRYVWRELARHQAGDDALVEFFDCAWQRARLPWFVETAKDRVERAAPWVQAAELARWSREHDIRVRMDPELAAALIRVADHYEEVAQREGRLNSPLVVKHHSNDDHARAYVLALGQLTRKLFAGALYS